MLGGSLELDYTAFDSTSTNGGGNALKTKSHDFNQQYNLYLNTNPFPAIRVNGGLLFQKDLTVSRTSNSDTQSFSSDTLQPTVDVLWQDPYNIFSAGAGYRLQRTKSESTGSPASTTVNEDYHTYLGWRPVELPSLTVQAIRQNRYDQAHVLLDTTTDTVLANTQYTPARGLDLSYSVTSIDTENKLTALGVQTLMQNGRVNYSNTFWGGRLSLATGYNISLVQTDTTQQGAGTVSFQVFPFAGLSNVTDSPAPTDILVANGMLIDGNTAVSAGVNIGSSLSLANDTKYREMGLDFSAITEVNTVFVWVNEQLTADIANFFSWDIYTSADNANWTPLQTAVKTNISPSCTALSGPCVTFGPFVNAFSIYFQNVKTRYLKVVTRPLAQTVPGATSPNYQNIFVTELQAFLNKSAAAVRGASSDLSQQYNLNVSAQIVPGVAYVFSYNLNEAVLKAGGTTMTTQQYTMTNGLSLTRRFKIGPWVTAGALFSRTDIYDSNGVRQGAYNYGASLTAVPLKTLRGSLVYSGTTADNGAKTDALTLTSTADLYPGISVNVGGGATSSVSEQGGRSTGVNFLSGVGIVPNPKVALSANYMTTRTGASGGVTPVNELRRSELDMTYRPFETLFLTASVARFSQTLRTPSTVHNYGLNWSPFPGGSLLFTFTYNESLASDTDTLQKTVGPNLVWTITNRATITLSYFVITSRSPVDTSEVRSLFAQYKMSVF